MGKFNDLQSKLETLEAQLNAKQPKFDAKKHKDETRARIALWFTGGFFILLGTILILTPIYNIFLSPNNVIPLKDILLVFSGVIGSPFGFVIGYYFKGSEE